MDVAIEQIKMPQLGESVTEGTISKWLVSVGDKVNKYDPLAEVMTDKVTAEIPSSFTGTIAEIIANEGETLKVGEVICTIHTENHVEEAPTEKKELIERKEEPVVADGSQKQRYSPAVLKLSQEHGIDLSLIKGTGAGGRITRKDVLAYIETGKTASVEESKVVKEKVEEKPVMKEETRQTEPVVEVAVGDKEIPVTPIRRAIANNMVRSKHEIPHAWTMVEVDVTKIVQYRDSVKKQFKEIEGFNLTYFAFFVKAVAQALKEFPQINSTWAGDKIVQKKDINISIAVATEDALFVPVIKHADEKSIKGIAREISLLAEKVRKGTLSTEDIQGGTFTVNNTGSFGSIQSMGIINYPQAAILQVESIVKRPVIVDGMIAIRDMVNLCLSLDHRVLDGLICGKFLQRVKEILENMSEENTPIY